MPAVGKPEWSGSKVSNRSHTTGKTQEPLPMFMAQEYHRWGEFDLGFTIQFQVGYEDISKGAENIGGNRASLRSSRKVTRALPLYSYTDAVGNVYRYEDCFEVVLNI